MLEPVRSEFDFRQLPGAKKILNLRNWRTIVLIFAFYSFLTVLYVPQIYYGDAINPHPRFWLFSIIQYVIGHYLWFFVTILVFWLSERFPFIQPLRLKNLAIHFALAVVIVTFYNALYYVLLGFSDGVGFGHFTRISKNNFLVFRYMTNSFVFYVGILASVQAVIYYSLYKDHELRLQQAQLLALKAQLHPHFLFNTLNAISALVYVSPADATKTISRLSDLLRQTLNREQAEEITLKDELDFLRKYIELHQTLLQERLTVDWMIDHDTLDALVPGMLLQPLVENSIRHGIAPKEEGGKLEITSRRAGRDLVLEIRDDGINPKDGRIAETGIGLINCADRLKFLYGDKQRFAAGRNPERGWIVTIAIPFREPIGEAA